MGVEFPKPISRWDIYPEPREPRVLPVGELVLWYGMFAPCGVSWEPRALPVGLHKKLLDKY